MRLTQQVERRSEQKIVIREGDGDELNSIVGGYKNARPPRYPQNPRKHGFGQPMKSEYDKSPAINLQKNMSQVSIAGAAPTDERRRKTSATDTRTGSLPTD